MANIIGSITINQSRFLELDASPLLASTSGVEIGDFCIVDGVPGIWQKTGSGSSDYVRLDAWTAFTSQATSSGTLQLNANSDSVRAFTGTAAGQIVKLPDATTLIAGFQYYIFNDSTQTVSIRDFGDNIIYNLGAGSRIFILLRDKSSANGVWTYDITLPAGGVTPHASTHRPDTGSDFLVTAAPTTNLAPSTTNATGTGDAFARNDHTHAVSTALVADISTIQPDDTAAAGTSDNFARGDHKHAIATDTAVSITDSTNSEGTATSFARADHQHAHGNRDGGTLHSNATTSVAGFMSSSDKTKLDSITVKSGRVASGSFSGTPRKATVTFSSAFASATYAVVVTGEDARTWTIESQTTSGFVINSNANQALAGNTSWIARPSGEIV